MELLITFGALYLLQCMIWLPGGASAFVRPLGSWMIVNGPGWRMLHWIPSAGSSVATRFPLVEVEGRLHGRGGQTWGSSRGWNELGPCLDAEQLSRAEVKGASVAVAGKVVVRSVAKEHAAMLERLLRGAAKRDGEGPSSAAKKAIRNSLSLARYREARKGLDAATRWLRWSTDLYFLTVFIPLPVAVWVLGPEAALFRSIPIVAFLHLLCLITYGLSHRRLHPGETGALVESLASAALYPPILMRGYQALRIRALGMFHPAVAAVAELPADRARAWLRTELLSVEDRGEAGRFVGIEVEALGQLAQELGESAESLMAPPDPSDPEARSFCPKCREQYRLEEGDCTDCDVPLQRFAAAAADVTASTESV